jgi:prepilin-type N-terminal cleavage/methylation domain-containing protein
VPLARKQLGFTLLEVIVATTLMAALTLILFSGFRLALNAWRRGNDRVEAMARNLGAIQAMRNQMASAIPRQLTVVNEGRVLRYLIFRGTSHQVRFLTLYSWAGDRSRGVWLATYRVVEQADGQQRLMLSEVGVSDEQHLQTALLAEDPPATRTEPFGEPADRIEFVYWQSRSAAAPASWVSDWKATEQVQLPRGVQVRWWRGRHAGTHTFVIPVVVEGK